MKLPAPLTLDDLYTLLYEEAAEVIKAATKCERFGPARYYPGYGLNKDALAREIGELNAVTDALKSNLKLDPKLIKAAKRQKLTRAAKAKKEAQSK